MAAEKAATPATAGAMNRGQVEQLGRQLTPRLTPTRLQAQRTDIIVTIEPVGWSDRFRARLDGRVLVRSSRVPFLDAARRLLELGHDPAAVMVMRHRRSAVDSLKATIGTAARLTVEERDSRPPRIVAWKARDLTEGSPGTAIEPPTATGHRTAALEAVS